MLNVGFRIIGANETGNVWANVTLLSPIHYNVNELVIDVNGVYERLVLIRHGKKINRLVLLSKEGDEIAVIRSRTR